MTRVESSALINAGPEMVWELISDIDRLSEWAPHVERVRCVSECDIGEGTIYRESGSPGLRQSEREWRIVEWDPPRRQVHRTNDGPLDLQVTLDLDLSDGYTRLHQRIDFQVFPNVRPLGWMLGRLFVRRKIRSNAQKMVQNVKRLVENE